MNLPHKKNLRPVVLFLLITFVLSGLFYTLIIYSGKTDGGRGLYATGLMWCPGLAALITLWLLKRPVSDLGWKWGKTKYQLWSYMIPVFYGLITYLIIWIFGWGGFYNKVFVSKLTESFGLGINSDGFTIVLYVILMSVFGIFRSIASALGEEIGWRGFLVPELYKNLGYTKTALITGLIWGTWHLPILIFADYNNSTPSWYALTNFMAGVIMTSFIYTWLRMKSGSLWTGVILHAAHNLFIQSILTPLTVSTGNTAYYSDEFGIVLPVVAIFFAVYFWSRSKKLESVPELV